MKKTIAFFTGFYLPYLGGIERYTYNVAKNLAEKGYRVIIVTSQHQDILKNKELVDNILIYRLPIHSFWKTRYPFLKKNKLYQQMLEEIKQEQIDFYICNTRFQLPSILGTQLAKTAGKKAIVIEHGSNYLTLNNPFIDQFLHLIERLLISKVKRNTSYFYGVSNQASNWLKNFNIKASGTLYNAVDQTDFEKFYRPAKKDNHKIIISYSGRLQAHFKGIELLLSAFTSLSKEFDNLELHIAGDGPLRSLIAKEYNQPNIKLLGKISHDQVMELNNRSDLFVLLSKIEGFSTAMLEAGLMKNVIITTDVGGARELIPTEDFGYIIKDEEEILVDTLRELILNPQKMQDIQDKISQQVLDNFSWDKTVEQLERLIEKIT